MLNNPQNNKVVTQKGPIGHTLQDIEIKQDTEYSVGDNVAFKNHLMNSDTNWDQIFHVSEKQGPKISKIQNFFEINKTLKNKTKQKSAKGSKILPTTKNWKQTLATTLRILSRN